MNIFKGMLYLHGYLTQPDVSDGPRRHFGADTAAADFVAPLGNQAASAAWFGETDAPHPSSDIGCVAGGCG
ncbi:MAG: hypothetical protein ACREPE_13475 [Lysobacter sp.]